MGFYTVYTLYRKRREHETSTTSNDRKKKKKSLCYLTLLTALLLSIAYPAFQVDEANRPLLQSVDYSLPFETALEMLQKQIGYNFKSIGVLRRAMTHASFSEENNKALSILGVSVIETSVSLHLLDKNIDISPKDLNHHISKITNVESSCSVDGIRLGLHKVIRVSSRTNSSMPVIVCGAFRAIFGAIAIDTQKSDDAGDVFWRIHGGEVGKARAF